MLGVLGHGLGSSVRVEIYRFWGVVVVRNSSSEF